MSGYGSVSERDTVLEFLNLEVLFVVQFKSLGAYFVGAGEISLEFVNSVLGLVEPPRVASRNTVNGVPVLVREGKQVDVRDQRNNQDDVYDGVEHGGFLSNKGIFNIG